MHHSEQSTSQENISFTVDDSNVLKELTSNNKCALKFDRSNQILQQNQQNDQLCPKSIEKHRFASTSLQTSFQNDLTDPRYHNMKKDTSHLHGSNLQHSHQNNNINKNSCEISESNMSQKKYKKGSQTFFTPEDLSFDDRISIQTMDSKQFSTYFQNNYEQRQLIDVVNQINSKDKKKNTNKDYFDFNIIEKDQEYENENNDQNAKSSYKKKNLIDSKRSQDEQVAYPKMQIEEPYHSHSKVTLQMNLNSNMNQNYHQNIIYSDQKIKQVLKTKERQFGELSRAFHEASTQNQALKQRIEQIQNELKKIAQRKSRQLSTKPDVQTKERFDKTVEFLRKYSL